MTQFEVPIAFLVFNRPETTARVFEEIRRIKPLKLLVVADGPRNDLPGEVEKCTIVRSIVDQVDWPCEVFKNYAKTNMGCKLRVSSGLDWVFRQVEEAIILEDDCLPHPTFFKFCEEMLIRYRNTNIFCINGNHSLGTIGGYNNSYYYTIFPNIWGWATWRRSWLLYDVTMSKWPRNKQNKLINKLFCQYPTIVTEWIKLFDKTYKGIINTWDYQLVMSSFENNSLCVQPYVNLIKNIGFDKDATITKNPNSSRANQSIVEITKQLVYPQKIERSYLQEIYALQNKSISVRIINVINKYIPAICKIYKLCLKVRNYSEVKSITKINIGCGGNVIDEPSWINLDIIPSRKVYYLDARHPLKFKDNTIEIIFTEHMLEHLYFDEALEFLKECYRVLKPSGVIRIAVPDLYVVHKILSGAAGSMQYVDYICDNFNCCDEYDTVNLLFYGHGHKYIYSYDKLKTVLNAIGFIDIIRENVGKSKCNELKNREYHSNVVGQDINCFETLVVEARKYEV
jgi:predicted SAM-dependent methyltransferase